MKKALVLLRFVVALFALSAVADDTLVKFRGGIGVLPVGRIHVDGRGLLLGGGNAIGFNANASVFATLICEAVAPFTEHSTNGAGVALAPNGDFRIDDLLVPAPPANCDSPVLLIRNSQPNPAWFAAGIPKQD